MSESTWRHLGLDKIADATNRAGRAIRDSFREAFEPMISGAWDGGAGTAARRAAKKRESPE